MAVSTGKRKLAKEIQFHERIYTEYKCSFGAERYSHSRKLSILEL
jgi:hypothetical protein